MPTVLDCLQNFPCVYHTTVHSTSVSRKPNAQALPRLYTEDFDGREGDFFQTPIYNDPRHYQVLPAFPDPDESNVSNEGDVRRVYAELAVMVARAYRSGPKVWHSWEHGPPGPGVTTAETIDAFWGVHIGGYGGRKHCTAICDLKRPGVIQRNDWSEVHPKEPTVRLGKEVRMYAFQYECPQGYLFDGDHLLLIRFPANTRANILDANCVAHILFVPKTAPQIPYWIDLLISEGLNRLRAEHANPLTLMEYERHFRYYDGKPYWTNRNREVLWDHPEGFRREYKNEQWWWALDGYADVEDTLKLE